MSDRDYLYDGTGTPDPEVAKLEELLRPLEHDAPLTEIRLPRRRHAPWITGALVIAAAAAIVLVLARRSDPAPSDCTGSTGFAFVAKGTTTCGGRQLARGVLPVGGTLDVGTDTVMLDIADIGHAELGAGTRIVLTQTTANKRHELHLERGTMHAKVLAPPRLFAITTPSTSVVDLGCEYRITIDETGAGSIAVSSGMVELASSAGVLVAPAGTRARLLAGRKPSVPVIDRAIPGLVDAVEAFESGDLTAIDRVLAASGPEDAITVVSLAILGPAAQKLTVLGRLAALVPPPDAITPDSAALSPSELQRWRDAVIAAHFAH